MNYTPKMLLAAFPERGDFGFRVMLDGYSKKVKSFNGIDYFYSILDCS